MAGERREHAGGADVHYTRLKADLLAGRFPPGTMLYETVLSSRYGVSRTPIREALGRLAQDRLIERSARGYLVRERSAEEIVSIYEARIALETEAAGLAAERGSTLDRHRLDHLHAARRDATDPGTFGGLNQRFHHALREAAHSEVVASMLARLDDMLTVYRPDHAEQASRDTSLEDHTAILDAVHRGDGAAARAAMADHLVRMRDLRVATLIHRSE